MASPDYIVDSLDGLAAAVVDRLGTVLSTRPSGPWTLAIAGGSVAERLLPLVARGRLPWNDARVFLADERAVGPEDPQANWRTCRQAVAGTPADRAAWHRPDMLAPDLDAAARAYAEALTAAAGAPPRLDAVLLGVGPDGHVASLFPGRPALAAQGLVVVERAAPKPPACRISLTLPVLAMARLTVVAAFGDEKRGAVRSARDRRARTPVARLLASAQGGLLLVDPAAGAAG